MKFLNKRLILGCVAIAGLGSGSVWGAQEEAPNSSETQPKSSSDPAELGSESVCGTQEEAPNSSETQPELSSDSAGLGSGSVCGIQEMVEAPNGSETQSESSSDLAGLGNESIEKTQESELEKQVNHMIGAEVISSEKCNKLAPFIELVDSFGKQLFPIKELKISDRALTKDDKEIKGIEKLVMPETKEKEEEEKGKNKEFFIENCNDVFDACENGATNLVEKYLRDGGDPNIRGFKERGKNQFQSNGTPLIYIAAISPYNKTLEILLNEKSLNINAQTLSYTDLGRAPKRTALHASILYFYPRNIRTLLGDGKLNPNIRDGNGNMPIHCFFSKICNWASSFIYKVPKCIKDKKVEYSSVHICRYPKETVFRILAYFIDNEKVDANATDANGNTVFHLAAAHENPEKWLEALISGKRKKFNDNILLKKNKEGKTALEILMKKIEEEEAIRIFAKIEPKVDGLTKRSKIQERYIEKKEKNF
ncbi:MAG: ankyrin repeat domain-containing protein [Holosporales bacterium]|jgi:ankyrin repeat protein|nr:ankyrin repeat domain-containing protein [Holosporales bacterium]